MKKYYQLYISSIKSENCSIKTFLLIFLSSINYNWASSNSPESIIEEAAKELFDNVKENKEEYKKDITPYYKIVNDVLAPILDYDSLIKQILGKQIYSTTSEKDRKRFTNAHETLIWASKSKKSKYTFNYQSLKCLNDDLQMRSDWTLPICNGKERLKKNGKKIHSTQKPEALLHRIILATTNKGDTVFDPFLGTGTTAVVSKKLGRNYYGIEKDKKYFLAAKERINKTETIADDYLDTIENNKSKPRIPFGSLVELGIIKPGTSLFDQKKKINAKIMADGSIKYKDTEGSIHKIAAKIMGAESYNGWTYWHYNLNGSTVLIDNLRQKFIAGKQI